MIGFHTYPDTQAVIGVEGPEGRANVVALCSQVKGERKKTVQPPPLYGRAPPFHFTGLKRVQGLSTSPAAWKNYLWKIIYFIYCSTCPGSPQVV